MTVVSLLTDFGLGDAYVGIVKGTILMVNPAATIVDITHGVPAGDLARAAYLIETAHGYFPPGSVHVVVVDPGVGSGRRIVALETGGHIFLAPDNGVLTRLMAGAAGIHAVSVENSSLFLSPVSRTFHGRDIFAPVAGHLSGGLALEALGPVVDCDGLARLDLPVPVWEGSGELLGEVIATDRFGNLITNISRGDLTKGAGRLDLSGVDIHIGGRMIRGVSETYADASPDKLMALFGSKDRLEISVSCGSARELLDAGPGDDVRVIGAEGPRDGGG